MKLEVTTDAKDYLAKEGYDKIYGARPLRRVIQRLIEDPLSETLLTTKFSAGDSVLVELVDGQITLTPVQKQPEPKAEDPDKDINIYINSPGGVVTDGLAIYDTMRYVSPRVSTVCMGLAASMATVLLAGGTKGLRFALPNTRVLIHQPSGGIQGQATDIQIHAKEILRMRQTLNEMLAKHTGQPIEKIERDTERDFFMSAQEAKEYGIIDDIIVTTARHSQSAVKDGRLELGTAGGGKPKPPPEPEREGPKTSP